MLLYIWTFYPWCVSFQLYWSGNSNYGSSVSLKSSIALCIIGGFRRTTTTTTNMIYLYMIHLYISKLSNEKKLYAKNTPTPNHIWHIIIYMSNIRIIFIYMHNVCRARIYFIRAGISQHIHTYLKFEIKVAYKNYMVLGTRDMTQSWRLNTEYVIVIAILWCFAQIRPIKTKFIFPCMCIMDTVWSLINWWYMNI